MIENNNPGPDNKYGKFVKYFSMLMTLVYPALGLYLLLSPPDKINLDPKIKMALGIVLIIYGMLRMYRTMQRNRRNP